MIQTKKQMFILIGSFILVILLGTVTFAFFNYTRTGVANVIKTGRISFSTSENGTLSLTNVFPVASNSVGNDYTVDTLQIAIEGDTTYGDGIEYLVTAEEVNVETSTGKKVPMTLKVGVTDNLGTQDTDSDEVEYFTDRGGTTSYYKLLSESVLYDGQYLLVGYIAPGQTGIDGIVNIKAFLDEERVAISDTYPEGEVSHTEGVEPNQETIIDGYNGTTSNWVDGRVVLTTSEWNSLQTAGNELSFKVKVEANEGTWVDSAIPINAVGSIPADLKQNITEIHFIKETPIRLQQRYDDASVKADMTDTTLNEGRVLGWQEGTTLYIASTGETYLPANSYAYFAGLSNVTNIVFENLNTSRVTNMTYMFSSDAGLTDMDISNWNTSNVTSMSAIFAGCSNLETVNLSGQGGNSLSNIGGLFSGVSTLREINMSGFNFGTSSMVALFASLTNLENVNLSNANISNVTSLEALFSNCSKVKNISLAGIDTSNVTSMKQLFYECSSLETVDLSGFDFSNVTTVDYFFENCLNLMTIYVSSNWNIANNVSSNYMFNGCTSLVGGQGTTFDSSITDKTYAHIDGGQSDPGYLTLKTN